MAVRLNDQHLAGFIKEEEYKAIAPQVALAHEALHSGAGLGNDFIGWVNLPTDYDKEEFSRIKAAAERIKKDTQVFIVIGIGGSSNPPITTPFPSKRRTSTSPATASAPRRSRSF